MAAASEPAPCTFADLPRALALEVFKRVACARERARCAVVCPDWRDTLTDRSAWLQLDLTRADGSACSEALLRAATSRAGGQLQALRLVCGHALFGALCAVAAANAATLQELRISAPAAADWEGRSIRDLEAMLRAAPQLRTLEADVDCDNLADAQRVLRNEPPFGPLRVLQLAVSGYAAAADVVIALAADLALHASLTSVWLYDAALDAPAALDAVVDAALARRLSSVKLSNCRLSPASAPALVRLLDGKTLAELGIAGGWGGQLLDAPAATLLADALRANTSLTALLLSGIELWRDAAAVAEIMGALVAHPRLRLLVLSWNEADSDGVQTAEAGAALAALLLANAPALQTLDICYSRLDDEGMGPVVEALRHNTHLTKLDCSWNAMSEAFARDVLLPAVRANTGLRKLFAGGLGRAAREAEALVAARTQPF
jgi:hypothetical protein